MMEESSITPIIVANKIKEMLQMPFELKGHKLRMTASIGIATYPTDAYDIDTLTKYADLAMYSAKNGGGNYFHFYTSQMNLDM